MGEWIKYPGDPAVGMEVFPVDNGAGAVVVCPGGGYHFVSPREAAPVAEAWNRAGFCAFVLTYSCEGAPLKERPLYQLSWAVSTVKGLAGQYGFSPDRVITCGFSAGGHLAGTLGVTWNRPEWYPKGTDLELHRPAAQVLCYPVITAGEYAHRGSFVNLAGTDRADQERYSLENLVTEQTPPTFLWHTMTDEAVPVQNTLLFSQKLLENHVPQEVHLFPFGVHGLSLATEEVTQTEKNRYPDSHIARWFSLAAEWALKCI
ncbi:prolyl oligopeptidase family serine peptidase [Clostridium sp. MCC353]|uniref:alpha/beta hydrolase n=1 Tax=Clostridium sp. MCC353 TaxID=2592646 RepID=UPI00207A09C6|nr:alpha/beta hydrolase [Clostridium sp. MCC353]MBT9776437.1 prolyl oligopeptidase family serine peptidase [Clostridium sp. MCC353]